MTIDPTQPANPGELKFIVRFSRLPETLTEEEEYQIEAGVEDIIANIRLDFLGEPIDANTMHAVRQALGAALFERYGDYYPEVIMLPISPQERES